MGCSEVEASAWLNKEVKECDNLSLSLRERRFAGKVGSRLSLQFAKEMRIVSEGKKTKEKNYTLGVELHLFGVCFSRTEDVVDETVLINDPT